MAAKGTREYPGDAARFEDRLAGLLAAIKDLALPPSITKFLHVMGGECKYLLQVNGDYRLEYVPDVLWKPKDMLDWSEKDMQMVLDDAKGASKSGAARLRLLENLELW